MIASDVSQARAELRTGARRCYLMAAQLREALGLPQRPSLMPPEEPEHGLCGYCGAPTATAYCGSTCAFYASRLRSVEEGRLFRGAGAPVSSLVDQELRRADAGRAARLLAAGAPWRLVAGELGLDHDDYLLRYMARSLAEAA